LDTTGKQPIQGWSLRDIQFRTTLIPNAALPPGGRQGRTLLNGWKVNAAKHHIHVVEYCNTARKDQILHMKTFGAAAADETHLARLGCIQGGSVRVLKKEVLEAQVPYLDSVFGNRRCSRRFPRCASTNPRRHPQLQELQ